MNKINKITLENGLRIISLPKPDSLTTTLMVLVEAGSKYETKEINGISHFLEHMCFKGTQKRPRAIDISSELDGIGADYNAFTSREYTGYYAKAQPKHFDKILDVISDMYLNSTFDEKEIKKESGSVIEEINMYEDMPQRNVGKLFLNLLYGDQPAGWNILGEKYVIKNITHDSFLKYKNDHYLASSTLIIVAGDYKEEEILGKIKKSFESVKVGEKIGKEKTKEFQTKPEILLKKKDSDQSHLVLGVRAYDIFDERKYALQILADLLGGGMSSRLFQKIREEMGAAYYVRSEADLFTDHGYLAAAAGVDINRIDLIVEAIIAEFKKTADELIDKEELQRTKDHIIGGLFLSLESSDEIASFYGDQEILVRKMITPQEYAEKIQNVTAEEVRTVAQDIFKNEKLNLALIGPFDEKARFEKILKF